MSRPPLIPYSGAAAMKWIPVFLAMVSVVAMAYAQDGYMPGSVLGRGSQHADGPILNVYEGKFWAISSGGVIYYVENCGKFKRAEVVGIRVTKQFLYVREAKGGILSCGILSHSDPLGDAVNHGDLAKVKELLKENPDLVGGTDNQGNTPLHLAVTTEVADVLLGNGANKNARNNDGETPLYWAARKGNAAVAELLLARGADANSKDQNGEDPLHMAALEGHKDVVAMLLASGADVNGKNRYGQEPLHLAATKSSTEVAELLLAKGADVNARDNDGETPLFVAATINYYGVTGYKDFVALLLAHGADANARNKNGEPPLKKARRDVVELLRQHGAHE